MKEADFSKKYQVRKLQKEDVWQIYELCSKNSIYYQYCPPFVSYESIEEDMAALPSGITNECKYYVGYYEVGNLLAVLDLIDGYPEKEVVFIGFFMCDISIQKRGIGTNIITELLNYIKIQGYKSVQLAWVKGNPQAEHFWLKNGFTVVKETSSNVADSSVILAEKRL